MALRLYAIRRKFKTHMPEALGGDTIHVTYALIDGEDIQVLEVWRQGMEVSQTLQGPVMDYIEGEAWINEGRYK